MGGSGVGEQGSPCSSPRACSTNVHEDLPKRKRSRLFGKRTLHARVSAREFRAHRVRAVSPGQRNGRVWPITAGNVLCMTKSQGDGCRWLSDEHIGALQNVFDSSTHAVVCRYAMTVNQRGVSINIELAE